MKISLVLLAAACLALAVTRLNAQQVQFPTPEEYARRQAKADSAPLFASHEPLAVTLRADISRIRAERSDTSDAEGTLSFKGLDKVDATVPVKVRARGNFRRDKRQCNFPPLRLDLPTKQVDSTVFAGQDKLKLVTPCHDSNDIFQQQVLQEYLVYRVYELITPVSYRVRLVTITYEDLNGGYETRTKTAFLVESDEQMAARNRAIRLEVAQLHPASMEPAQEALVSLFQFMIGNTDFSAPYFHNVKVIRDQSGALLVVPYDFDWSGVVGARYAVPDPRLKIRDVRERLYRGFCRPDVDQAALAKRFNDQKEAIWALYQGMDGLEYNLKKRSLDYYGDFYKILNDPRRYDREVTRECRKIPSTGL